MTEQYYKIALLFNANKVYDRQVVEGIGQYIQASQCMWDIFVEDEFIYHTDTINQLSIDGIIADFDDPKTVELLQHTLIPTIAVGGSYKQADFYPHFPYVATDNMALVEMALSHLQEKGLSQFAFYGLQVNTHKHWSIERRDAFVELMEKNHYPIYLYEGVQVHAQNWLEEQQKLIVWLKSLPSHTGIIAVTDARARHLLQACEYSKISVPEELCVVGIDNEELIQYLSRVSLSSVEQGTREIGYQAAKLLHKLLNGQKVSHTPILIPPITVHSRNSTDYRSLTDPLVIQAMHYIRHRACHRIKVEQVLDHLETSRSNLEQRFKNEMNKTIHQVIHEEKISRAKNLLQQTDISIQEIAEICGYSSIQYFYSVFKKEFEMTPKEFRLNC
ncbi:XylR family transcriptional regulator [Haemophilus influenzae]|uniref:XylR family transcriptional regulator n=1 Tax=Haemophilus influenzae TaxID=727 RepID=UPI000802B439|nr:XylR family transcriptional regulator [Haemophilus influenzae]MCK9095374.1 XylR family transcriptional regulator [Haemophilus influenzae]OBX53359.1 XylR family transcriptional regulator [Haemophilus influenzae]POR98575.1 xylose operon transcription regulator XylR [Haemophilus influenzae]VEB28978.1 DNA-binding transcriptional activator, xylose-binding [Haemophilus influenzae]